MDLEAWVLPAGRLGVAAMCAAGMCSTAIAKDTPQQAKIVKQFKADMNSSLGLMLRGPQILQVTADEIVISDLRHDQCNGTTQPNVVSPTAFQRSVDALNAINNARANGKTVKVTVQPAHFNCFGPDGRPLVPPSPPHAPTAPASAASR